MAYQNVDNLQGATIVTNPVNLKGSWTQILCLESCTSVSVVDENLTPDSEQWTDSEFMPGSNLIGHFREITCTGKVVLYA